MNIVSIYNIGKYVVYTNEVKGTTLERTSNKHAFLSRFCESQTGRSIYEYNVRDRYVACGKCSLLLFLFLIYSLPVELLAADVR